MVESVGEEGGCFLPSPPPHLETAEVVLLDEKGRRGAVWKRPFGVDRI